MTMSSSAFSAHSRAGVVNKTTSLLAGPRRSFGMLPGGEEFEHAESLHVAGVACPVSSSPLAPAMRPGRFDDLAARPQQSRSQQPVLEHRILVCEMLALPLRSELTARAAAFGAVTLDGLLNPYPCRTWHHGRPASQLARLCGRRTDTIAAPSLLSVRVANWVWSENSRSTTRVDRCATHHTITYDGRAIRKARVRMLLVPSTSCRVNCICWFSC